jgi:DNA repair protein SbcD/Mre11
MKIFATADIHLGRVPARLPAEVARRYSPRRAFESLVETAIKEQADALLLAGDIADNDRTFIEAYGVLQGAVTRLRAANIPLIAVAGNHDTRILPELERAIDDKDAFCLLGANGEWGMKDVACRDGRRVRVIGWSFPSRHYNGNPLDSYPGAGDNPPELVLGLLHADRDGPAGSRYAPVASAALEAAAGIDHWILGHVHRPDPLADAPRQFYAGSLQALDPSETGLHGAVEIDAAGLERRCGGGLRYENIALDAGGLVGAGDLLPLLAGQVERLRAEDESFEALSARIAIDGESELEPDAIRRSLGGNEQADIQMHGCSVYVERLEIDMHAPLDLDELARGRDTTGRLARLLQKLESGAADGELDELIEKAKARLREVDGAAAFEALADAACDGDIESAARRLLARQGYALLRDLCRQREERQ